VLRLPSYFSIFFGSGLEFCFEMNKLALKIQKISDRSRTEPFQENMMVFTHEVRKFLVASHTDEEDAVVTALLV